VGLAAKQGEGGESFFAVSYVGAWLGPLNSTFYSSRSNFRQ